MADAAESYGLALLTEECGEKYEAFSLNEKGQCPSCRIKPLVYKRPPRKFCHRCDRTACRNHRPHPQRARADCARSPGAKAMSEDDRRRGLITEEQKGYDRGVADARKESPPTPSGFNEGVEAAAEVLSEQIAHVVENSTALAKYNFASNEARCRQLCTTYLDEVRSLVLALRRADPRPDAVAETAGLVDDDGLLRSVGLLFFDAMSVRCEPRSYARRCIQLVQERIAALHAPAPTAPNPPVWRHDFNAYVPVQRSARSEADEGLAFAIAEEREACAVIADDDEGHFTWAGTDSGVKIRQQVAREIAAAIRARAAITALDAARGKS